MHETISICSTPLAAPSLNFYNSLVHQEGRRAPRQPASTPARWLPIREMRLKKQLKERGKSFAETSLEELDVIWEEAKKRLSQKNLGAPHSSKPAIKKRPTKS